MKSFRLIRSEASSAAYNMNFDEKIFNRYLEDGIGVLRIYRWGKSSFTYGFSQNPRNEINLDKCASDGIQIAKRMTGGGILFHHDEITYSFVCSKDDVGEPQGIFVSYRNICKFLIQFYESLGVAAEFALETKNFKERSAAHQLCSAAYEKYDIVIGGRKIGGNAQKRKRQVIFQHGSIPLRVDWDFVRNYLNCLPDNISTYVTTLSDEIGVVPEREVLERGLIDAFSETFGVKFIEEKESVYETCLA
ncbi:MAG: lipoate--protein ligase family protein [Candidatus Omnitrophica bacterium]|nr:lipoate--protein ligase family protein [Candidatus Omnitrophota bacterium]